MTAGIPVVAIGASAGGVAALPIVLSALSARLPAAVLVVLHLNPRVRSMLAHVLARDCALPVREAHAGDTIEAGCVYVAPAGSHLTLRGDSIVLTDAAPVRYARPSVDVLFASIADTCGPRGIGVILTGAGVDGADGMRAIKAAGGRTIVQEPTTSEHRGMPTAARATGCAEFTLTLAGIGPQIETLVRETMRKTTAEARG